MSPASDPFVALRNRIALGSNIRATRKARKFTLAAVASLTGLSVPKLCRIENGSERFAKYDDIVQIAHALGVGVTGLLPSGVTVWHVPRLHFGEES